MTVELVRVRGRVSAVKQGDITRHVVRDAHGRIAGLEGESPVEGAVAELVGVVSDLDASISEIERLTAAVPEQIEALRTELATKLPASAVSREMEAIHRELAASTVPSQIEAMRADLAARLDHLEGWRPAGELSINVERVRAAAAAIDIHWPITVAWLTPTEETELLASTRELRGEQVTVVNGCRRASTERRHTVALKRGLSDTEANSTLAHELVHSRQVELYGNRFDSEYTASPDTFEDEAEQVAAVLVQAIPTMVRRTR